MTMDLADYYEQGARDARCSAAVSPPPFEAFADLYGAGRAEFASYLDGWHSVKGPPSDPGPAAA